MPRLVRFVLAGLVGVTLAAPSAFAAERSITGAEAAKLLLGKAFQIACFDGTRGRGHFNEHGVAAVSYRRSGATSGPEERDRAAIRARGPELCVHWARFGGGGEGCYPVTEYGTGLYRIGSNALWCDVNARQDVNNVKPEANAKP